MLAYEGGDWDDLSQKAGRFGIKLSEAPDLYMKAVEWSQQNFPEA